MHKELKNEVVEHSTLIFSSLCSTTLQKFPPESKFSFIKVYFSAPC
jgi:hypothetical protein